MKPTPPRALPLVQADLFDAATAPAPLTRLQQRHDDLVALLSQLLWQVASQFDADEQMENDDEQDQP